VEWQRVDVPPTMSAGKTVAVEVTFKNTSSDTWPDPRHASPATGDGSYAVRLSYRWWKSGAAKPLAADEKRTDLTAPVLPRQSATLHVSVTAPTEPGDYLLQFDLVQELVTWFEDKNASKLIVSVKVR
jgi:hypothetical protein